MLSYLTLYLFPAFLLLAAAYDVGQYRIPNWLCASLAGAFVPVSILSGMPYVAIGFSLLTGIIVLIIGMSLFAFRLVGGGDAKLLAAATLWIGAPGILPYIVAVGIIGGVFALLLLLFRRFPLPAVMAGQPWILRLHTASEGIPYGVALAAAGILVYPQTVLFSHLAG